jgi:hypothetical protein
MTDQHLRHLVLVLALIGLSMGCSGGERVNANCLWLHDPSFPLQLTDRGHQTHIRYDADLLEDLAIRYADAHAGRVARPEWAEARDACMTKLFAVIGANHGLSEAQIRGWIGRRNLGFDLAVFLSFLLGLGVASNALMRRLFNAWSFRGGLAIVAGTAATLMVSVAGGSSGALWAAFWEVVRLGNEHVSHRASRLPWPYYVPSLFLAALVVCSLAARRAHRTVARRTDLEDAPAWRRTLLG